MMAMPVLKSRAGYQRVVSRVLDGIDTLADGANSGALNADEWQSEMAQLLLAGHVASYREGINRELTLAELERLADRFEKQLDYLNAFANKVDAEGWQDARDRARAAMYAGHLKSEYWRGKTLGLELPAYPGDGSTECLTNCRCSWRLVWKGDPDDGNVDCFWTMGGDEHCRTCAQRARIWAPLRIRDGVQA